MAASAVLGAAMSLMAAGCASEPEAWPTDIPRDALLVRQGTGPIACSTGEDGMIYVFEVPSDKMIYTGAIQTGQLATIDPLHNRVVVGNMLRNSQNMDQDAMHRIYFEAASQAARQISLHPATRQNNSGERTPLGVDGQ